MKFYTSVAKRLKLNVRDFWGLILTLAEVTEEYLIGELFANIPISPIDLYKDFAETDVKALTSI